MKQLSHLDASGHNKLLCTFIVLLIIYLRYMVNIANQNVLGTHEKLSHKSHYNICAQVRPHLNMPIKTIFNLSCSKISKNIQSEIVMSQLKSLNARSKHIEITASWMDDTITSFLQNNSWYGLIYM